MKITIGSTSGSASIHVTDSGARKGTEGRPALVFAHFFGGSGRTWREVASRLEGEFRCIALDARGFGESDAPPLQWSVSRAADDIEAALQVLGAPECVLVGHSMGGKAALALAARRPKYLRGLALLAPSPPTPEPMDDSARARLAASYGSRALTEEVLRQATARPLDEEPFERCVQDSLRASASAWRWWLESGSREDISAQAPHVEAPTLVVAGEKDAAMTPQVLEREVVARIGGARLEVVAGAAHLLPLEAPDEVARLLRQHAERCA